MTALVVMLALAGCSASGDHKSDAAQVRQAILAQIKAINDDDCQAFADVTDLGSVTRAAFASRLCDNNRLASNGLKLTHYTVVKVTMIGTDRAKARVEYIRTDLSWGTSPDEDTWHVRKVNGRWKVNHQFGM